MTGRRVWWYFVAFFGIIAAVNTGMITLALRTHSGTVTDHPYEKGLAYNQVVKAEEAQEKTGWKGHISYAHGALNFTLSSADDKPLVPDQAIATFTRPTQQGMDFTAELTHPETAVSFPAPGSWEVRVDVIYHGVHYQQSKRIVVE